jgi:hypothetical protein
MHNRESWWRTADGRSIQIKDMKDSHLVNVINWISDNRAVYPTSVLNDMIAEAKYRQTLLFAEGKTYPQKVGRAWKLIDPLTGEGRIVPPPTDYIEAVKDNPGYQVMSKRTQEKRRSKL